jgi:hypothetical protein
MAKKTTKLNSFAVHPQFKSTYHCKECEKLMNHDSSAPAPDSSSAAQPAGTASSTSAPAASDTPDRPSPIAGGY